jgi:hypothetical protein
MYTIGVISRLDRNLNKASDRVMLSTHQYPEGRTSRYPSVCTYGTLARQAVPVEYAAALKRQFGRRILTQHACTEILSAA